MQVKCPSCHAEIDGDQMSCPYCGQQLKVEIVEEKELLEGEVVENTQSPYQQQMAFQQMLSGYGINVQKAWSYYRLLNNKKIVAVATVLFFTSPVAIILTVLGIYQNIFLLTHMKDYEQVRNFVPTNPPAEEAKKPILYALLFNILFLILSCGIAYYFYVWRNQ